MLWNVTAVKHLYDLVYVVSGRAHTHGLKTWLRSAVSGRLAPAESRGKHSRSVLSFTKRGRQQVSLSASIYQRSCDRVYGADYYTRLFTALNNEESPKLPAVRTAQQCGGNIPVSFAPFISLSLSRHLRGNFPRVDLHAMYSEGQTALLWGCTRRCSIPFLALNNNIWKNNKVELDPLRVTDLIYLWFRTRLTSETRFEQPDQIYFSFRLFKCCFSEQ